MCWVCRLPNLYQTTESWLSFPPPCLQPHVLDLSHPPILLFNKPHLPGQAYNVLAPASYIADEAANCVHTWYWYRSLPIHQFPLRAEREQWSRRADWHSSNRNHASGFPYNTRSTPSSGAMRRDHTNHTSTFQRSEVRSVVTLLWHSYHNTSSAPCTSSAADRTHSTYRPCLYPSAFARRGI